MFEKFNMFRCIFVGMWFIIVIDIVVCKCIGGVEFYESYVWWFELVVLIDIFFGKRFCYVVIFIDVFFKIFLF